MAKKQSRRSVSINPLYYVRLKAYADKVGKSQSKVIQECLDALLGPPTPEELQKFGEFMDKVHKGTQVVKTASVTHVPPQRPEPEPPRTAPAPPELHVPEPIRQLRHGPRPRRLSTGSPIEPSQKRQEPQKDAEGFEDYVSPILKF